MASDGTSVGQIRSVGADINHKGSGTIQNAYSLLGQNRNTGSGTIVNSFGATVSSTNSGSGAITSSAGLNATTTNSGTGTTTVANAIQARVWPPTAGTIGRASGLDISVRDAAGGGTIDDAYGIRIANVEGATNSNYAIYTGAGDIRFGTLPHQRRTIPIIL